MSGMITRKTNLSNADTEIVSLGKEMELSQTALRRIDEAAKTGCIIAVHTNGIDQLALWAIRMVKERNLAVVIQMLLEARLQQGAKI
jgi:hypothetical protein